jgi:predicted NAD/FAD-dependent oxidoreductase
MMRSLPSALASAIDGGTGSNGVRLATQVTSIASGPGGWRVATLNEGSTGILSADTLVLTAPAPQALALLDNGRAMVSSTTMSQLADVVYAPSLTVLARPADRTLGGDALASRPTVGPGTAAPDLERVHRNESTGASAVVAVTIQASAAFSAAHLDGDRDTAAATAATQASTALGVPLEVVHIHGWRYAQVITGIDVGVDPPALLDASSGSPLVLAGDHFGPSVLAGSVEASLGGVERAYLSGTAAAGLLL